MAAPTDTGFGPKLAKVFDFTLTFEHAILGILPTTLLIATFPILLFYYGQLPDVILPGNLLWAKLICSSLLIGIELAILVLCRTSSTLLSDDVTLASASLWFCASVCVTIILYLAHRRALRSSAIVALWLIIAIACDIVRARSYFLRGNMDVIAASTVVLIALKTGLVGLEEVPKKSDIKDEDLQKSIGKEATSGFLSRSLFLWLNSMLSFGFRNRLDMDHLDDLDPCFSSTTLSNAFSERYPSVRKLSPMGFVVAVFRVLWIQFFKVIFPRLCYIAFSYSQPLFLHAVVRFIESNGSGAVQKGALIAAAALIYMGIGLSRASFSHHSFRLVTQVRGVLTALIFEKTLRLNHSEAQQAAAVTLMSTDIDGIATGLPELHNVWGNFVEIAIGIYLLARTVGRAAFVAVFPALVSTLAAAYLGKKMPDARKLWTDKTELRVSEASATLSQIKALKIIGLEGVATKRLQSLREDEVKQSKKFRLWTVVLVTTSVFCDSIPGPIILSAGLFWTTFSGRITTLDAFTTLAVVQLMAEPISHFLSSYATISSTQACVHRIFNFLCIEEREDCRQTVAQRHERVADPTEKCHTASNVSEASPDNVQERANTKDYVIELRNASIKAHGADESTLCSVDVSIERNELVMVTGPTGSGKSTLLRAILGDAELTEGSLYVEPGNAAYCDQTVWLCNGTVRDNIVADSSWDEPWYNTVLDACLLRGDLRQLSNGDLTEIGSKGAGLSGGQKDRVALARALFARGSVILLDDVFRSLDRKTACQIFANLFGPDGLLSKSPATVLLATHSIQLLESADKIVIIDAEHKVTVAASLNETISEQIRETALAVNRALGRPDDHGEDDGDDESNDDIVDGGINETSEIVEEKVGDTVQATENDNSLSVSQSTTPTPDETDNGDRQEKRTGDLRLYLYYFQFFGKMTMILWLLDVFLVTFTESFPIAYVRIWLDIDPDNNLFFVGYVVLSLSASIFTAIDLGLWFLKLVPQSNIRMHELLLRTTMCATLYFLTKTDHGSLLNHFSQDMHLVSLNLPLTFLRVVYSFSTVLIKTGIILSGTQFTALLLPVLCLIVYLIQYYYLRTSRQIRHLDLEAQSPLYTQFTENAAGLRHIRAFGWEAKKLKKSLQLLDASQKPSYYMFSVQRWLTLVMDSTTFLTAVVVVTIAVCVQSATSPTGVALSLVGLISFSSSLSAVVQDWTSLETSVAALERLNHFSKTTPIEEDPEDPVELPAVWPERGQVSLQNVIAKYGPDEKSPVVLDNVTAIIPAGQKFGIVGRTGSGKSSIIMTLLKFTEFVGNIFIDGKDIRRISHGELRTRITTISQDLIQFGDTVRFNVCPWTMSDSPGKDGNPEDVAIIKVLRQLGLWDFIQAKGGLDTKLCDLGLSHGQLQLLCIARGLLHKVSFRGKLVLMDEPTSGLDIETQKLVQQVFKDTFADCTVITVAHRVETLSDANIILHMDNGKVVARTKPAELTETSAT